MLHSVLSLEHTELFSPSWCRPQTMLKVVAQPSGLHGEVALVPSA